MEYNIDAKGRVLGRLASEISSILQGKKNANYDPRKLGDDTVIVKNVSGLVLTGRKPTQKIYYRHTGPLGHLKERKFADVFKKKPEWVLRNAVRTMLPKNRLRAKRMTRLTFEK